MKGGRDEERERGKRKRREKGEKKWKRNVREKED